ncbi:MAG: hypothetical protein INR68_16185 [Methylobacterium mesophilicum]|nr:hypothetical protein [Methylobacterium mesophilicum]
MQGNEWDYVKVSRRSPLAEAGFGVLRATLLFSSVAVALTLLIVPAVDKNPRLAMNMPGKPQLDMMTTASVTRGDPAPTYTLRRSVLQPSPDAVCRIEANGARSGAC